MIKIIHAADIHLDSPLTGLSRYDDAPVQAIRGATRAALDNLVRLCLKENARLLLIAGDLYDGDWKDYNTGLHFVRQMARLTREGIQVVLVRGNHDAASQITRHLPLPDGVRELSTRKPETFHLEKLGLAIHGQGYRSASVTQDLVPDYPAPVDGLVNIGLLHTSVDGRPGHQPYAPCTLERLINQGYDYWALGHVHRREELATDPWVVFPGNLQGRHARETGAKGASVVSIADGAVVDVEHRPLDTVRWAHCRVDAAGADSPYTLVEQVEAALAALAEATEGRLLAARVTVSGRSKAHDPLQNHPEHWIAQIRAAAAGLGADAWVEKVHLDTRTPLDLDALAAHDDPLGSLVQAVRGYGDDPQVLRELLAGLADLNNKLPAEYRQLDQALDLSDPLTVAGLLDEVEQTLIPRLLEARQEP